MFFVHIFFNEKSVCNVIMLVSHSLCECVQNVFILFLEFEREGAVEHIETFVFITVLLSLKYKCRLVINMPSSTRSS